MRVLAVLLAIVSCVSAFSPRSNARTSRVAALAMKESNPFSKFTIPAALMPILAPMASIAAEGTGRVSFKIMSHIANTH